MGNHIAQKHLTTHHSNAKARIVGFITGCRQLATKEGDAMADQLAAAMEKSDQEVALAQKAYETSRESKVESKADDKWFQAALKGIVALFQLAEPAKAASLPDPDNYQGVDLDYLGQKLSEALGTNKKMQPLNELLKEAKAKRLASQRAYQQAVTEQLHIRQGRASVSELHMLMLQAEALIRRTAAPGSPAYQAFKRKVGAKSKKGSKTNPTPVVAGSSTSGETSSTTPAPHPARIPVQVTAPTPPPAAVMNGVHA
jgi:hypothetical protein